MATSFPTAIDTFVNPTATDTLDSATVPHASQHTNENDALLALQTKVGINGSTDANSLDYKVAHLPSASLTIQNKTTAYTVVVGDLATIINCTSGTFTVSLTAAATLGAGFNCWVWNTGTGVITIDPSTTETIEGSTTIQLAQGQGLFIICDGTNWKVGQQKINGASLLSTTIGRNSGGTSSQAVTGGGAMALGGSYASGTDSFAAAIANNTSSYGATGANSVAIGKTSTASGASSFAIGQTCTSSGQLSFTFGDSCQSTVLLAYAMGSQAKSERTGKFAYATAAFATTGDAQRADMILRASTTDATPKLLTATNATATTLNQVMLNDNSAYAFVGTIVSKQSGSTNASAWKIEGLIVRGVGAATTTLVASTITAISNIPAWTLALSADTTNGGLAVTFTGAAATNIRTVCTIETSEVVYA